MSSTNGFATVFLTDPTVFSYTLTLMQTITINLGPYTSSAHLHDTMVAFTTLSGTTITASPTLLAHVGSW